MRRFWKRVKRPSTLSIGGGGLAIGLAFPRGGPRATCSATRFTPPPLLPSEEELIELINSVDDGDKDGQIQLREFLKLYTQGLDSKLSGQAGKEEGGQAGDDLCGV